MKLRSGKIVGKKELPAVLKEELDNTLLDFKESLIDYKKVGKEVLEMVIEARNFETVYKVDRLLQDYGILDGVRALGGIFGSLVGLIIGKHNFYVDQEIDSIIKMRLKKGFYCLLIIL